MRQYLFIFVLVLTCLASATIKDPRQHVKLSPELSQDAVARQQQLQREQSQVGGVPDKTDSTGYLQRADNDAGASSIIASHETAPGSGANEILQTNGQEMNAQAAKPRRTALGAIWAILVGLLLAFGAWAGANKYGGKPPSLMAR
jgi:hypothetical protein